MAKTYNGGINLTTSYKLNNPSPIADYMVVSLIADLTATSPVTLPNQFNGMLVFVEEDNNFYSRKGGVWAIETPNLTDYVKNTTTPVVSGNLPEFDTITGKLIKDSGKKVGDFQNAANKVTSWSTTPLDTNYPSEKLVKDSLDSIGGTVTNLMTLDTNQNVSGIKIFDNSYIDTSRLLTLPSFTYDYLASTVTFGSCLAVVYSLPNGEGLLRQFTIPGKTMTLLDNGQGNYNEIYVDYNEGSPIFNITITPGTINSSDKLWAGSVYGFGGVIYYLPDATTNRWGATHFIQPISSTSNQDPTQGIKTLVIGTGSGSLDIGQENCVYGEYAARELTGLRNIIIGAGALETKTNVKGCIIQGWEADVYQNGVEDVNDAIVIGNQAIGAPYSISLGTSCLNDEENTVQIGSTSIPMTKLKVWTSPISNRDLIADIDYSKLPSSAGVIADSTQLMATDLVDPTKLAVIHAFKCIFPDFTDTSNPTYTIVDVPVQSGITITTPPNQSSFVGCRLSGSTVEFFSVTDTLDFNSSTEIGLGAIDNEGGTLYYNDKPFFIQDGYSHFRQFILARYPTTVISGGDITPIAGYLKWTRGAGQYWKYMVNKDIQNLNIITITDPASPSTYYSYNQSGPYNVSTYIDPTKYDDGGPMTATVPDNKWSIIYVMYWAGDVANGGSVYEGYQRGDRVFNSKNDALANLKDLDITHPELRSTAVNSHIIIIKKECIDLSDIDTCQIIRLNDKGLYPSNDVKLSAAHQSGVVSWEGASILATGGTNTVFNVNKTEIAVIDYTDMVNPIKYLTYIPASTNNTATYRETHAASSIGWDFINKTIHQQVELFTPIQLLSIIPLGKLKHHNKSTIESIIDLPSMYSTSREYTIGLMSYGTRKLNGYVISPNGDNLFVNHSQGDFERIGCGTDGTMNYTEVPSANAISVIHVTKDANNKAIFDDATTTIDLTKYESAPDTLTDVAVNRYSNVYFYVFPYKTTEIVYVIRDTQEYTSLQLAESGILTNGVIIPVDLVGGCVIGAISFRGGSITSLPTSIAALDVSIMQINNTNGGCNTATNQSLQSTYNSSVTPEILTDATRGAFSVKNGAGTADNVTNTFDSLDSSGNTTSYIRADGLINCIELIQSTTLINRKKVEYFEDLISVPTTERASWISAGNSGTGSATNQGTPVIGHQGVINCVTGTDTTGWSRLYTYSKQFIFGSESFVTECIFKTPDTLPTADENYYITFGFAENGTYWFGGSDACALVFGLDTTAKWGMHTKINGGAEVTTWVTGLPTVSTWYHLKIVVNSAGTSAEFFVNNVSIGTQSTGMPTGRSVELVLNIIKTAGTTSRAMTIDAIGIEYQYPTVR